MQFLAIFLALMILGSSVRAAEAYRPVDVSIDRALAWLADQQREDGSFRHSDTNGTAYTGLVLLAYLSCGHLPGRSEYGGRVTRAIESLLAVSARQEGYFGTDGSRMYGHGIATLALSQAYGVCTEEATNLRIGNALVRAVAIIGEAQHSDGSWNYERSPNAGDLSVSGWQALALRGAQQAHVPIDEAALARAAAFAWRCFDRETAHFRYRPGDVRPARAMRASGLTLVTLLQPSRTGEQAGWHARASAHLAEAIPQHGRHYYYELFCVAQATAVVDPRQNALPQLRSVLLGLQEKSGAFAKHSGHDGGVYATAFAVLALSADYRLLPVFHSPASRRNPS